MKDKKTTFAYEEAHPEDGPFCWNGAIEKVIEKEQEKCLKNI